MLGGGKVEDRVRGYSEVRVEGEDWGWSGVWVGCKECRVGNRVGGLSQG